MRRLLAGLVVLAVFALCAPSYGAINSGHYVLVYKSNITAAKTVFDANNPVNLLSGSFLGYLAVDVCDTTDANKGRVFDSDAVIYNQKNKIYKLIPNAVSISPHDPCYVEMFTFTDSNFGFDVVGKGKATKIYEPKRHGRDPNTLVTKYVPTSMKGGGWFDELTLNDSNILLSGTATVSLTLDPKLTASANSDGNNVGEVINAIVQLTLRDPNSWINWENRYYDLFDACDIAAMLGQMSAGRIDGSDGNEFLPGTWFIYITGEHRYGKMIVEDFDTQSNELTLGWTTYSSDGSIYSSGTGLVIDGTFTFDLDEGLVTGTGADFWWEIVSSTTRYLWAENNALFKLMYRAK
ncbi:MAG: hypothetical protein ABSG22_04350 [Sedimentisphaerales bacterium]|jgi:hypothetical protein